MSLLSFLLKELPLNPKVFRYLPLTQLSDGLIYGGGNQVISFCYVSDATKGIVDTLLKNKTDGEIFNTGNDSEPISIKDLAERIIRLSGKTKIMPEFVSMEDSDRTKEREVYHRVPSIEKAKKALHYSPKISLDEGILKVFEFENNLKQNG